MDQTTRIAKTLERFAQAIASHDRENPTHTAYGIGLNPFDIERLGLEEGEEILPGITLEADSGVTGNFRVLCDGQHELEEEGQEAEEVDAVASEYVSLPVSPEHAEGPAG
jgi:hypothetical protein